MKRYLPLGLRKALPTVLVSGFAGTLPSASVAITEMISVGSARNLDNGEGLQLTDCNLCLLQQLTVLGILNA